MFEKYPHTDLHELNLDWIIKKVKELSTAWAQVQQDWTDEQAAFANLQSWIENYFNNLDVQTEINVKLDSMVVAGTMSELIAPYVASGLPAEVADQIGDVVAAQIGPVVAAQISAVVADQLPAVAAAAAAQEVSAWLALHVNPDTGYVIDDSFTVQGAAADAKAVGDEFTAIKSALTNVKTANDATVEVSLKVTYTKQTIDLTQVTKIADSYLDRWGEVQPEGQNNCDIYMIPVVAGDIYFITADYRTAPLYGLYTDDDTISSWWPTTDQGSWKHAVDYEVEIPIGITYLAVNSGLHSVDAVVKKGIPTYNRYVTLNELYGLKLVTAGDSITEGSAIPDETALDPSERHTYGLLAKEHYNMNYLNIGLAGRTMADVSVDGVSKNGFAVERYLLVPNDTDVLTIWFGWNDYAYGYQSIRDDYAVAQYGKYYSQLTDEEKATIPSASQCKTEFIGDINSASTKTWGGAWNFVLNYFTVTNPIKKIGVIIPYLDVSSSGTYKTQMCELLKSICNKYGVPYIEAMKPNDVPSIGFSDPVQANASELKAVYTADGTHPNKAGYLRIARGYIPFIARI